MWCRSWQASQNVRRCASTWAVTKRTACAPYWLHPVHPRTICVQSACLHTSSCPGCHSGWSWAVLLFPVGTSLHHQERGTFPWFGHAPFQYQLWSWAGYNPFVFVLRMASHSQKLLHWSSELQQYNLDIVHRTGNDNLLAGWLAQQVCCPGCQYCDSSLKCSYCCWTLYDELCQLPVIELCWTVGSEHYVIYWLLILLILWLHMWWTVAYRSSCLAMFVLIIWSYCILFVNVCIGSWWSYCVCMTGSLYPLLLFTYGWNGWRQKLQISHTDWPPGVVSTKRKIG